MTATLPRIVPAGLDGLIVRFGDILSEPANRAALAYRAAFDAEGVDGVAETATSLVSTFVRFAPGADPDAVQARAAALMDSRDWTEAALPSGRRLVRVPT